MLREIENAIDWSFIYDEVKGLYKEAEWENSGIDPIVLFKIVFIQYLYGIRSMRQTIKEIEVNIAYRWFIGYDLTEPIPHFSTFGKNYKRRFEGTDIFERIFRHILEEAVKCSFVDASAIFIDGTHIRANANKKKFVKEVVAVEAKRYQKELDEEINRNRKEHEKKPLKDKNDDDEDDSGNGGASSRGETKEITRSTSDPTICKNCPCREQCTKSKDFQKTVTRHVWEQYMEMIDDYRHTPWVKDLYDMRKQKIERVFADAKVKHGLRYTQLRGLAKVTMQVTLTFACMNLKKLAKWKRRTSSPTSFFAPFLLFFQNVFSSIQKSVHTSAFAAG